MVYDALSVLVLVDFSRNERAIIDLRIERGGSLQN